MRRDMGFTLMELMVVVAVIGVASALAIPNVIGELPNLQIKSASRNLFSDFQRAKLTAIKRNTNCTIVFGQQIDSITYSYVVFVDADNDLEYDGGEEIVTSVRWSDYRYLVATGQTFTTNDDGLRAIAFRSNGIPIPNGGGFAGGTATLINTKGHSMQVVISQAGNIRIPT